MIFQYGGCFLPAVHFLVHYFPTAVANLVDFCVVTPARWENSCTSFLVDGSLAVVFKIHNYLEFLVKLLMHIAKQKREKKMKGCKHFNEQKLLE